MLLAAVIIAAVWGGAGPGLAATGLGVLLGDYFFMPPLYSLSVGSVETRAHLALFAVLGVVVSLVARARQRALARVRVQSAALDHSEARFQAIVNQATAGVILCDVDGRFTMVNPRFCEMVGYSEAELLAMRMQEITHPEDLPSNMEEFRKLVEGGPDYAFEKRYVRKNGVILWIGLSVGAVREGGKVRQVIGVAQDITAHKAAEDQLRRNHDTFYHLIQNNPFGIYIVDAEFRLRQASRGAEKVFSHVRPLLGRDFAEVLRCIWTEPFASEAIGRFRHTLKTGEPYAAHRSVERRHDIEEVEAYDWRIERIVLPDGRFGVVCYFYDLSARERLEEALRASEERFQLAARATNDAIWDWDLETSVLWWNEGVQALFGYRAEQVTQTTEWWNEKIHPEERDRVLAGIRSVISGGGTSWREEYRFRCANGRYAHVFDRGYVIRDSDGKAMRMIGALQDLTDRKASEVALRESEERLRLATQTGKVGLWDWDITTGQVTWTDSLYAIHGVVKDRFQPTVDGFVALVHPDDRAGVRRRMKTTLEESLPYEVSFRAVKPDGEVIWLFANARLIRTGGRPARLIGATLDITEMKRAEETLRQNEERLRAARDEAEAASHAKDQFLAALSHELRNPLNPVLLTAGDMLMQARVSGEERDAWELVRKNVALEAALIDDLLDLTRIAQGKVALHVAAVDIHKVLHDALGTVEEALQQKGIMVDLELAATRHVLRGDPVRLQQIFWNVLNNAVKFTPAAGAIRVCSRDGEDETLLVEIGDNGMGMTEEELGRLFEAFQQGDHADRRGSHRFGGLGLGMAITRQLVQMHGGTIGATSKGRGQGSLFTIAFRARAELNVHGGDGESVEAGAVSESTDAKPNGEVSEQRSVLLVEDHDPTRGTLATLLRRRGYEVTMARSMAEARAIAGRQQFELVLSDLGLPDGDGRVLMRELREAYGQGIRGIAISGYGMPEDVKRSIEAGFCVHLTKPVEIDALEMALREAGR